MSIKNKIQITEEKIYSAVVSAKKIIYFYIHQIPRKYLYCIAFVLLSCWTVFWGIMTICPHHDGIMLRAAIEVAHGACIFREVYTHYGILTTMLQAFACYLFGDQLIVIRLQAVFFLLANYYLLFCLGKYLLEEKYQWLPVAVATLTNSMYFHSFRPWSSQYANFFLLLGAYWMLKAIDSTSEKAKLCYWFCSGLTFSCMVACRQSLLIVELAIPMFLLLSLWGKRDRRNLLWQEFVMFITGNLAILSLICAYLFYKGALFDMWEKSFLAIFRWGTGIVTNGSSRFLIFYTIVNEPFFLLVAVFVVLLFFHQIWAISHNKFSAAMQWKWLIITLISGAALHQYFPVPSPASCYFAAFPAMLIFTYVGQLMDCEGSLQWKNSSKRIVLLTVLWSIPVIFFQTHFYLQGSVARWIDLRGFREKNTPIQGMLISIQERDAYKQFAKACKNIPKKYHDRTVVNATRDALCGFFFSQKRITDGNIVDFHGDKRKIIQYLKATEKKPILIAPTGMFDDYPEYDCYQTVAMPAEFYIGYMTFYNVSNSQYCIYLPCD